MQIREELQQIAARLIEISKSLPEDEPTGDVVEVNASEGRLQKALDSAKSGQTLILHGAFEGNFVIRTAAEEPITIQGGLIISPNQQPALTIHPGAAYWTFKNNEIATSWDKRTGTHWNLINFINDSPWTTPRHFEFDGCDIHGTPTGNVRRGIAMNAAHVTVKNCRFSEFHEVGADSQAICCWNGPGPFTITNNHIEAAGENIMFGGGNAAYEGLIPTDILISGNRLTKPLRWREGHPEYAGIRWTVKNLLELKNARLVSILGNLMEHSWTGAQHGYAVLMTPRSQEGKMPWATVRNVVIKGNVIRRCAAGFQVSSSDNKGPTEQVRDIEIANNLLYEINESWSGRGTMMTISGRDGRFPIDNLNVHHNTFRHLGEGGQFLGLDGSGTSVEGFRFIENIVDHGRNGLHGSGHGVGLEAMEAYCVVWDFSRNLILGGKRFASKYPNENFWEDSAENAGLGDDFKLAPDSIYATASNSDGPIGCDLDLTDFEKMS